VLAVASARARERTDALAALREVLAKSSVTGLPTNLDRLQRLAAESR
jgi:acetyl/propionyl-CoA carboxylase alpha subunit